jgi:hypothetical protein
MGDYDVPCGVKSLVKKKGREDQKRKLGRKNVV